MTRSIELAKQIGFEWKSDNPLIFPQVWDVASARVLAKANFPLLTTSASAYAWAQGYRPGERVGLEELLVVAGRIVREVKLPLLADLEGCFERSNQDIKKGVKAALSIGSKGVFISDGGRDGLHQMLAIMEVANRLKSSRLAALELKTPLFLVARTDALSLASILANPFEETIERVNAYFNAGADLVLIEGVQNRDVVAQLMQKSNGPIAISVVHPHAPSLQEYRDMGVAALSLGTGLQRSALSDMARKAEILQSSGQFMHLDDAITENELSDLFVGSSETIKPLAANS